MSPMLTAHHALAFAVIAVCGVAGIVSLAAWRRRRRAGAWTGQLLALAQTLLVGQVGLGLLLLSDGRRAADRLHYAYGTLALAAVLAPWLYAPADPRRRLVWFGGATLVAAALAVRAYLTAT
jgi:Na+(H+)/acetate symporter ActP